jgi:phage terminase large subunit GpA-like protein
MWSAARTALKVMKPPPRLSVSEWADRERRLDSQSSSEPGRWYTSRAEYQRGIMDACSDPSTPEVVVMAGAQLGKTEAILNILGFHIAHDPCPILVMQPTLEMAHAFSKDRVAAGLVRSTPALRGKIKDPRARDSGNTTLHKVFPGGALTLVGANSAAGLASRPVRILLADEVDRFPSSAGTEGDPILLGRKRTATFWNRKVIMVSTPTNKGASRIEQAFEASDQRRYHVPCRHCEQFQVLKWANVQWIDKDPETARYACEGCGALWTDADRIWAIRNGEWRASKPFTGVAGFAINGMYSPWTPLADGVRDFMAAKKSPEMLRVWTNTYLGETWEDQGETVDDWALAERREPLPSIPDEVIVLTAGVDVQDNRLEVTLLGHGRDDETWVLSHDTLWGDPSTPQLWTALDSKLFAQYETESGRQLMVRSSCVDSGGHYTNAVYSYCKRNAGRRVFAIKGVGGEGKAMVGRPSKNNVGKCPLFPVGVHTVKDVVFGRLKVSEIGPSYVHFSDTLPDEYFKQLTAEKIVTRYHKGFQRREFIKTRPRNEALDCFVYALAAHAIIGVNVNALAARLEAAPVETEEKAPPAPARQGFIPRPQRVGGFVNSWR